MYFLPPESLAARAERDLVPTDDEEVSGCALVDLWQSLRRDTVELRRTVCDGCPLNTGAWPRETRLFRIARRHLALLEAGLAPGREAYTQRERAAILHVHDEVKRLRSAAREQAGR